MISTSRPKRITPISFRRISCTIPLIPESNSTISPYMAWSIPSMLAIPSATDLTTPISMPLASKSKFSISVFKIEIIPSVEVEFLICSIFCSNCFIRPLVLQSNSSPPARITKPSPREGSSSSSRSISSLPHFRMRKLRIPISCSSVGSLHKKGQHEIPRQTGVSAHNKPWQSPEISPLHCYHIIPSESP